MTKNIRTINVFAVSLFVSLLFGCAVSPPVEPDIAQDSVAPDSFELVWDSPSKNPDGADSNNLAGYRIYYGTNSGVYPKKIVVDDPTATKYNIGKLSPGTYYFVITTIDGSGRESTYSNEATVTVK